MHNSNFFLSKFWQFCVFIRLLAERQLIFEYMFVTLYTSCCNQSNLETESEKPLPPFLILFIYIEVLQHFGPSSKTGDFRTKDDVIQ